MSPVEYANDLRLKIFSNNKANSRSFSSFFSVIPLCKEYYEILEGNASCSRKVPKYHVYVLKTLAKVTNFPPTAGQILPRIGFLSSCDDIMSPFFFSGLLIFFACKVLLRQLKKCKTLLILQKDETKTKGELYRSKPLISMFNIWITKDL